MIDIACGIPSYNEEDSISNVAGQLDNGLSEYFPGRKAVIINMDSCSTDKTREAFMDTRTKAAKQTLIKEGVRGKGNMVEMLLGFIAENGVKYALMADADLKSITPDWVYLLLKPLLNGYDYCTPLYSRHKYDGTITNLIVYPVVCGLYGQNIRQPIGGDFSFTAQTAGIWMSRDWPESTRQYGIDNFLTTSAVCHGLRICQVKLGAKIHKASGPKLGRMFKQVVDTLFTNVYACRDYIAAREEFVEPEVFGKKEGVPGDVRLDRRDIENKARERIEKHRRFLGKLLPGDIWGRLGEGIGAGDWCTAVYSILREFNGADRESLLEAFAGLYFLRILSFMDETKDAGAETAEEIIRDNAMIFFEKRDMFTDSPAADEA